MKKHTYMTYKFGSSQEFNLIENSNFTYTIAHSGLSLSHQGALIKHFALFEKCIADYLLVDTQSGKKARSALETAFCLDAVSIFTAAYDATKEQVIPHTNYLREVYNRLRVDKRFTKQEVNTPSLKLQVHELMVKVPEKEQKPDKYWTDNDLLPEGAYASPKGIEGNKRRALKIGTISIVFNEIEKDKCRVYSISGILPLNKLPDVYLSNQEFTCWYDMKKGAILTPSGYLFIIGFAYTKHSIKAKLEYLVKCGRHLHEINKKLQAEKVSPGSTHSKQFVIQI